MESTRLLEVALEAPALEGTEAKVRAVTGTEHVSAPFRFEVTVVLPPGAEVDAHALLRDRVALVLSRDGEEQRRIHGAVLAVEDLLLPDEAGYSALVVTVVPRLALLALSRRLEVFVSQSVPEIVQAKLERAGLQAGEDFELRLTHAHPRREFVVQYEESDLAFVQRLTEHVGIRFRFEHASGRDVVVFEDANAGVPADAPSIVYARRQTGGGIYDLRSALTNIPSKVLLSDYDYERPALDLTARASLSAGIGGEIYEYGASYTSPEEGKWLARVRAEGIAAGRHVYSGRADDLRIGAGLVARLEEYPRGDLALHFTEVEHEASSVPGAGGVAGYTLRFKAISADVAYRPPRTTPRPTIGGLLTGVIDASEKGEYAEIDEHGRYRVKLLFDASGLADGHASLPVRMAQPHAGAGYGMHFPLRPGVEVLVAFVNGDPDRPVIAGCAPNTFTPSPVTRANASKNVIRTGGSNEIHFEDAQGSQRIKLSTPHKSTVVQLGSPNGPEAGVLLATEGGVTSIGKTATSSFGLLNTSISTLSAVMSKDVITVAGREWTVWLEAILEMAEAIEETANTILSGAASMADKTAIAALEATVEAYRRKRDEAQKDYEDALAEEVEPTETEVEAKRRTWEDCTDATKAQKKTDYETARANRDAALAEHAKDVKEKKDEYDQQQKNLDAAEQTEDLKLDELAESAREVGEAVTNAALAGARMLVSTIATIHSHRAKAKVRAELDARYWEALAMLEEALGQPGLPVALIGPYNIAQSENTAAVFSERTAVVQGEYTAVNAEKIAAVIGKQVKIAGVEGIDASSAEKISLKSGATVLINATESIEASAENVTVEGAASIELSGGAVVIDSAGALDITSEGEASVEAAALNVTAPATTIESEVSITGDVNVLSEGVIFQVTTEGVNAGTEGAAALSLQPESGMALLATATNQLVLGASGAALAAPTVTIEGETEVTITASGTILLG